LVVTALSSTELARGIRREQRNWYTAGVAGVLVSQNRHWKGLLHTSYAKRDLTLRLRSGEKLQIRADEFFIFVEVFVTRDYSHPHVDLRSCTSIVDVGANVGMASIWFARECPNARVFAVEPAPRPLERLRRNVAANRLEERVTIIPAAISVQSGTGFVETIGSSALGRFTSTTGAASAGVELAEVQATTLADVLEPAGGRADLMKLDCEGGEYAVLDESNHSVLQQVRSVVGEYHVFGGHSRDEFIRLLADRGYDQAWVNPVGFDSGLFWATRSSD
jgi:FkbM family methyltransferase